jgi:hypothetical protein
VIKHLLLTTCFASAALAQGEGHPVTHALEMQEEAVSQQNTIGAVVDPNLSFTDERGYPFQLRQLFPGTQPVVLLLGYYCCPAMCGVVMESAFRAVERDGTAARHRLPHPQRLDRSERDSGEGLRAQAGLPAQAQEDGRRRRVASARRRRGEHQAPLRHHGLPLLLVAAHGSVCSPAVADLS